MLVYWVYMEIYDPVAKEYAGVFEDIRLRYFEWPWLQKQIQRYKPLSFLDLGCGNGYLSKALVGTIPNLSAAEPSGPMFQLAKERLGHDVAIYQAAAENLPFDDECFDMIVSFLSFRYMQWDRALKEIRRVLKQDGVFILIDLFAGSLNPVYLPKYIKTWIATRLQYSMDQEYYRKLSQLIQNRDWQEMVKLHPKRIFSDAKKSIKEKFIIEKQKILSTGLKGRTIGLVCTKPLFISGKSEYSS